MILIAFQYWVYNRDQRKGTRKQSVQ